MAARPLNPTAAALLGFLHAGPMSGWDLVATAETVIGDFWTVTRSQVYRELRTMTAAGLVEAGQPEARERRPFTITAAGRAAFAEWIAREPGSETIRFPLLLTISFGRHLEPGQLAGFVHRHRAIHARRLGDYEQQRASAEASDAEPDVYAMATLTFGITYERAVLAWFDQLPPAIRGPQPYSAAAPP